MLKPSTLLLLLVFATTAACRGEAPDQLADAAPPEALGGASAHPAPPGGVVNTPHAHASDEAPAAAPSEAAAPSATEAPSDTEAPTQAAVPPSETITGEGRGVQWAVTDRWPVASEEDDFRVRTWRLPARSMAGAGECALYRFPGGGDPQDNLRRWMGQFRGEDGSVESVEADQAQRTVNGVMTWLVRARGTFINQDPARGPSAPEERFENYGLFGAVLVAGGDPVFVKCVGPFDLISAETNTILALIDSLLITPN